MSGLRSLGNNTWIVNSWASDGTFWYPKSPPVSNFAYVTYASVFGDDPSPQVRALIKQLVSAEDAKAPLSDARISQILGEQGIVVARRTIAKYRESLQIPPVNQRKAL